MSKKGKKFQKLEKTAKMSKNRQYAIKNVLELAKYRNMSKKKENTDKKVQKPKRNY